MTAATLLPIAQTSSMTSDDCVPSVNAGCGVPESQEGRMSDSTASVTAVTLLPIAQTSPMTSDDWAPSVNAG